jgi:hypothetical protein
VWVQVPPSAPNNGALRGRLRRAIEHHIREVDAFYRPLILQHSARLAGGERLVYEYDHSVSAFRKYGRHQVSGLIERVNELSVARQLLLDPDLASAFIYYEPEILKGQKFDFVIRKSGEPPLYIEVKSVTPNMSINEMTWRKAKYAARQVVLDLTAERVEQPAQAQLSQAVQARAVQAAFLRNAVETAAKLATCTAIEPGPGLLIYCGDGQSWSRAELAAFAKSYVGADLSFGLMLRPQDALFPTTFECHAQPIRFNSAHHIF